MKFLEHSLLLIIITINVSIIIILLLVSLLLLLPVNITVIIIISGDFENHTDDHSGLPTEVLGVSDHSRFSLPRSLQGRLAEHLSRK